MPVAFYVFMVTTNCPECGQPLMLDGPALQVTCRMCRSLVDIPAAEWKDIVSFPSQMQRQLQLKEGDLRTSLNIGREFTMRVRWGPKQPSCACGALVDLATCPMGTDADLPCVCGRTVATFPAPEWLRAVSLRATQLWGVLREGVAAPDDVARDSTKPISFSCVECGANLKITSESARLLECTYCKSELFLPDQLWFAIHPIRTRQRWYIAFVSP